MQLPIFKIRAHNAIEILGSLSKPELSAGAKTHCKTWLKHQLYGRRREFSSKYTEKGIECEQEAINMVADKMGYGMIFKNTERVSDDYMEGECDFMLTEIVEDVKNSWDVFTFPLFETEIPDKKYEVQIKIYMHLYNKPKGAVNYVLIDTPEHLIEREEKSQYYKLGISEIDIDLNEEIRNKMTYTNIPKHLRVKRYEFEPDPELIEAIKKRVILCREYISELYSSVMNNHITLNDKVNDTPITVHEKI